MNRELHDLHQNVRDLSSDQIRLEEHLNREIDRRERWGTTLFVWFLQMDLKGVEIWEYFFV